MTQVDAKMELVGKLRDFRRRIVAGEDVADEELRDAIKALRELRDTTSKAAKKPAAKKAASKITHADATDLLKDLL